MYHHVFATIGLDYRRLGQEMQSHQYRDVNFEHFEVFVVLVVWRKRMIEEEELSMMMVELLN